jgi:hypothetical protein
MTKRPTKRHDSRPIPLWPIKRRPKLNLILYNNPGSPGCRYRRENDYAPGHQTCTLLCTVGRYAVLQQNKRTLPFVITLGDLRSFWEPLPTPVKS